MRLVQKPKVADSAGKISSLLRVDSEIFAELLRRERENYVFAIRFKIRLDNATKNLNDFNKVTVTVKKIESEQSEAAGLKSASLLQSGISGVPSANSVIPNAIAKNALKGAKLLKPDNGIPMQKLPQKLEAKAYAGLQILEDLLTEEDYVDRKDVAIDAAIQESFQNSYTDTEIFVPSFKFDIRSNREIAEKQNARPLTNLAFEKDVKLVRRDSDDIDPNDLIERVNLELVDPTAPVNDDTVGKMNSQTHLSDVKTKLMKVMKGESSLYHDLVKYYMDVVPEHPREENVTRYEKRVVSKTQDSVEFETEVTIPYFLKLNTLQVRFDLFEVESNNIEETLFVELPVASHVDAFETPKVCPEVSVSKVPTLPRSKITNFNNQYIVNVFNPKPSEGIPIKGHNIYLKSISKIGEVTEYRPVGFIPADSKNLKVVTNTDLSVIRAVPVGVTNKESNVYTNVIVGPGYDVIGNLTVLPSHFGKNNQTKIEIVNIPKSTNSITLYKRDCTDNPDNRFKPYTTLRGTKGISASVIDRQTLTGRVYEYYAVATLLRREKEVPITSNYAMFKNVPSIVNNKAMTVTMSNQKFGRGQGESFEISFQLTTVLSKTENEKITETLKSQLGELYKQFLDPNSNASSPLGDERGVPQYSDLIMHEIVRTNLNTSERETFELVPDGVFTDGYATQKNSNIKPINPAFSYSYQVYTYKKNPIELFKKYIAKGTDSKGREWFYLPYKWLNPKAKSGHLYPDDKNGIPVIDAYESFTSESYGLTAFYTTTGMAQFTSLTDVIADRLDRNTVIVSWNFRGASELNKINLYDSFVVMKVVNGIRSFVGRTSEKFIYHELDESDIGSVYYIVVPIMSEFDIDEAGYSSPIVIHPEGLTRKIKKPTIGSSTPLKNLTQESLKNFVPSTVDLSSTVAGNKSASSFLKNYKDG